MNCVNIFSDKEIMNRKIHMHIDYVSNLECNANHPLVFVGNLAWKVTTMDVMDYFKEYNVIWSQVMTDMRGKSKGFALLQFNNKFDSEAAIDSMNSTEILSRKIVCRYSNPSDIRCRVKVSELPLDTTEEEIRNYFSDSKIIDVQVSSKRRRKKKNQTIKEAVLRFENELFALQAIYNSQNSYFKHNKISVVPYKTPGKIRVSRDDAL